MGKVIIGIHGLSNKPEAKLLQKWWWLAIKEGLQKHTENSYKKPIFRLVYWADVLYDAPKDPQIRDQDSPFYLKERYVPETEPVLKRKVETRKKIMDVILHQMDKILLNEDYSLNLTSLSDIIIKRFFRDLDAYYDPQQKKDGRTIKDIIRNRLKEMLDRYKNDDIFLIAHSMGSIVAYDVLTIYALEIKLGTLATIGSPLGLPIVVSKIAREIGYTNLGQKLITPPCIKNNWYNFSDLEDKVAFDYSLHDDFSANSKGIQVQNFEVSNNYEYLGNPNPHKSFGYLRTREFSLKLYDFLSKRRITLMERIWNQLYHFFRNQYTSLTK